MTGSNKTNNLTLNRITSNYINYNDPFLVDKQDVIAYDTTGTCVSNDAFVYKNLSNNEMESIIRRMNTCKPTIIECNTSSLINTILQGNMACKIEDVEILIPNKVVKVTFNDGTFEKAICHEEDIFNLDTAIGICIAKHFCGGSSKYNNLINKGLKLYNAKIKAKEDAKLEQERIEAKRKKYQEKKAKRLARKAKEERDARIKEQAEAIVLANEMMNIESINNDFQFDK